ncbi:DUF4349 domain-containing protein [Spirillospora sp. CA-255316]
MRIERTVRHALCVLVVLLLAGALAACGGGGGNDASSSQAGRPAPAAPEGGADRDSSGNRTSGGGTGGSGSGTGDSGNRQTNQEPLPTARSVVYTADLRVRADNVEQAAARAKQLATSAGGYVENESSASEPAGATLSLKIPADRYVTVLNDLTARLGKKLSLRQQAEDVTREVADVDSRVRSAQATLASFRKLLDRANTVGEVINVEEEIARRQADLESLQARQKALQHSTRYATVSITLESPGTRAAPEKPEGGFLGGLKNGWEAFTAFLSGLATVLGWLLPFLALAAAIGGPALVVRRRFKERPAGGTARGSRSSLGSPAASAPEPEPVPVGAVPPPQAAGRPQPAAPPQAAPRQAPPPQAAPPEQATPPKPEPEPDADAPKPPE